MTFVELQESPAIGQEDFETAEEWRDFLRELGIGPLPHGYRISLSAVGEQRLCDATDVETVEVSGWVEFGSR